MSVDHAPFYYVLVQPQGQPVASRIDATDTILSFEFEDNEKKADLLKLTVDNWDLEHFDNPTWRPGNKLLVTWGYPGKMAPQRECIIQKVEGSLVLNITAQSKAVLMNKETKSKTYENTRRSEIVYAIAKDYGYEGDAVDIDETTEMYEHVIQARATDAQFLKRLADLEHFEFYIDQSGFNWHARRTGKRPLRVLQYYLPPDVGDIITFNVENDIFAKPTTVTTKGRDPLKKEDVKGVGSDATTERKALQPPDDKAGALSGTYKQVVDPKTGQLSLQSNQTNEEVKPTTETSTAQAKKEADGAFKRAVQVTVKLDIDLVGDPLICAKSVVDIRGISKRLSGLYYINVATHKIDSSGYKLKIKCSTDGTHGHSQSLIDEGGSGSGFGVPATLAACKSKEASLIDEMRTLISTKGGSWPGVGQPPSPASLQNDPEIKRKLAELEIVSSRCKALAAAASKADPNAGGADKTDPNALVPQKTVDPKTGEVKVTYLPPGQPTKETK